MQNRQIDKKKTMQIRIDVGLHRLLKIKAAKSEMSIKTLLEDYLAELLAVDNDSSSELSTIDYFRNKHKSKKEQLEIS